MWWEHTTLVGVYVHNTFRFWIDNELSIELGPETQNHTMWDGKVICPFVLGPVTHTLWCDRLSNCDNHSASIFFIESLYPCRFFIEHLMHVGEEYSIIRSFPTVSHTFFDWPKSFVILIDGIHFKTGECLSLNGYSIISLCQKVCKLDTTDTCAFSEGVRYTHNCTCWLYYWELCSLLIWQCRYLQAPYCRHLPRDTFEILSFLSMGWVPNQFDWKCICDILQL
jgi:hypothetical protein